MVSFKHMSRPLRIEYPGALYHVMSRGNASQDIFLDEMDRHLFLKNLRHCIKQHNLICHAYCLMGNHYHLLIETPDANLSESMRDINGNYTQCFNVKHERVGHLMQGRYKAFVIEKDLYLLEVVRYIVNNPVMAKLVTHPKDWKWSSYKTTAGFVRNPQWLETNFTLGLFSNKKNEAQKQYQVFVNNDLEKKSPYAEVKEGVILGSPQFVHWIWQTQSNGSEDIKEIPRDQRVVGRPTLKEIFDEKMTRDERNAAINFAKIRCGYLITEIARQIGLDPSTVGKMIKSNNS